MPRIIKPFNIAEKEDSDVNSASVKTKESGFVVLQYHGKYENNEEKIDYQDMKKTILDSMNDFCNEQLYGEKYYISLGRPYYDIKKITLFIDMTYYGRINNIFFDVSGTREVFKKKSDNMYVFEPLQPIQCRHSVNTNYNVLIDMIETKNMFINKLILSVEFQNNVHYNINPHHMYQRNNQMSHLITTEYDY